MSLFSVFLYLAYAIFYKTFFKCFELFFYKPPLTSVHDVRKVHTCLVRKSDVSNDAHSFTNPGGVWIPHSVMYGISLNLTTQAAAEEIGRAACVVMQAGSC